MWGTVLLLAVVVGADPCGSARWHSCSPVRSGCACYWATSSAAGV